MLDARERMAGAVNHFRTAAGQEAAAFKAVVDQGVLLRSAYQKPNLITKGAGFIASMGVYATYRLTGESPAKISWEMTDNIIFLQTVKNGTHRR